MEMTKNTVMVGRDLNGRVYVYQAIDESDKNHSENDNSDDMIGEGKETLMKIFCHYINLDRQN